MKRKLNQLYSAHHLYKHRKSIWSMLRSVLAGDFKLRFFSYLVLVGCLVYTIMPFDLLPDFIPFIGWVDDGIFLMLLIQQLKRELPRYTLYMNKKSVLPIR